MKKLFLIALAVLTLLQSGLLWATAAEFTLNSDAKSVILIEAETGTVLFEEEADLTLPPASVTKVMTMLLIMEAIDSGRIFLSDIVQVSANAASMGGSQVFLEEGETMMVEELLKCVVIASANDACVALAEYIFGSEETFVAEMNKRAAELGMVHTNFENTTGLDDTTQNHVTTARDIATMSAELIVNHPQILQYSSIWMDSIRGGEFGLTNTNRLIRFYSGANGLKTGSTAKAKFCISASAKRNGMQLICVVMGAETRDSRNETAKKLFDFGFANFAYERFDEMPMENIRVLGGNVDTLPLSYDCYDFVTAKNNAGKTTSEIVLPETVSAPIKAGDVIGSIRYSLDGELVAELPIVAAEDIAKITFKELFIKLFYEFLY